ncbi:MAG: redox-sensing transcriptional repressor Rex [Actinomycetota bacterium]
MPPDATPVPNNSVPAATVARLPLYLRCLEQLERDEVETVSSSRLAALAGVNAAKLRKDLSHLGSYGTRGVGYQVAHLMRSIRFELGLDEQSPVVVIGLGNLGQALVNHAGFGERGFPIVAVFDIDPDKIGRIVGGQSVAHLDDIDSIVQTQGARTAIITTPVHAAQDATDRAIEAGITSVLNFAPTVVQVPDGVALRQVDLALELQILSYYQPRGEASRDKNLRASG